MPVDYNNILIVNIPRNGSSCIPFLTLTGTGENSEVNSAREFKLYKEGRFDSLLQLKSKIDVAPFNKISIVRNPYTRAYSLYKRYLFLVELSEDDVTFTQFLNKIKNNGTFHPISRGLISKTQSWFLLDENGAIDANVRIYKLENLNELTIELEIPNLNHANRLLFDSDEQIEEFLTERQTTFEDVDFDLNVAIQNRKKKKYYSSLKRREAYTQECIDLVQEIYATDFDNFNYSRNIDGII
jgi:hypothetical protein